jgi:sugar O-acyltransferase (sialic acid O-acetyltransferase NeuD family)
MKRALIGKGGHAREVSVLLPFQVDLFTDEEFLNTNYHDYEVMIAVGSSVVRKEIALKLPDDVKFFSYIHDTAIVGSQVIISSGSFVGPHCVLTCNITLGEHSLLLRSNHVGHDTTAGNFLSMMGGAIVNGNCKLGEQCYLGSNSSIREKIHITDNVTIGMNACVVKNISQPGTYVGVPCYKVK